MLDSLLFLTFLLAGAFFTIVSLVILLVGLIGKKKQVLRIGFWSLILPVFFFGSIYYYFYVFTPRSNVEQMEMYSGNYILKDSDRRTVLTLKKDGTYICDSISGVSFTDTGTWDTASMDDMFSIIEKDGKLHALERSSESDGSKTIGFQTDKMYLEFVKEK